TGGARSGAVGGRAARARRPRRGPAPRPGPSPPRSPPPRARPARPPPPAPSSVRAAVLLLHTEHLRDVVEHAVHEGSGIVTAEAARDLDRLVDDDGRRDVGPCDELEGGDAEEVQIDARETREPPGLGARCDQAVDPLEPGPHAVDQLLRELAHRGRRVEVAPEEREPAADVALAGDVELVERLEGELAGFAPAAHQYLCTARSTCTI